MRIRAKCADICHDVIDLVIREQIPEPGHDGGEAEVRSAVYDDSFPCGIWLRSGLVATGEVRPCVRTLELGQLLICALSIRTMACDATAFIDGLAVPGVGCARVN